MYRNSADINNGYGNGKLQKVGGVYSDQLILLV